jgi:hypothetical protein
MDMSWIVALQKRLFGKGVPGHLVHQIRSFLLRLFYLKEILRARQLENKRNAIRVEEEYIRLFDIYVKSMRRAGATPGEVRKVMRDILMPRMQAYFEASSTTDFSADHIEIPPSANQSELPLEDNRQHRDVSER